MSGSWVFLVNATWHQLRGTPTGQLNGRGLIGGTVDDEHADGDGAQFVAVVGVERRLEHLHGRGGRGGRAPAHLVVDQRRGDASPRWTAK